jgi:hypothetical protein
MSYNPPKNWRDYDVKLEGFGKSARRFAEVAECNIEADDVIQKILSWKPNEWPDICRNAELADPEESWSGGRFVVSRAIEEICSDHLYKEIGEYEQTMTEEDDAVLDRDLEEGSFIVIWQGEPRPKSIIDGKEVTF